MHEVMPHHDVVCPCPPDATPSFSVLPSLALAALHRIPRPLSTSAERAPPWSRAELAASGAPTPSRVLLTQSCLSRSRAGRAVHAEAIRSPEPCLRHCCCEAAMRGREALCRHRVSCLGPPSFEAEPLLRSTRARWSSSAPSLLAVSPAAPSPPATAAMAMRARGHAAVGRPWVSCAPARVRAWPRLAAPHPIATGTAALAGRTASPVCPAP
jgi:hypothetical protein